MSSDSILETEMRLINWRYVKWGLVALVAVEVGMLMALGFQYANIGMFYLAVAESVGMAILITFIEE